MDCPLRSTLILSGIGLIGMGQTLARVFNSSIRRAGDWLSNACISLGLFTNIDVTNELSIKFSKGL